MINYNSKRIKKWIIYACIASFLVLSILFIMDDKQRAYTEENVISDTFKVKKRDYRAFLHKKFYSKITSKTSNDLEKLELVNKDIDSILKVKVKAYSINVNGKDIVNFKTKEEAIKLLEEIKKPFMEDGIKDLKFKEDVSIVETIAGINDFKDFDEALYYVTKGTSEVRKHKVEKGENYWTIAKKYKIKASDLVRANPDIDPERLQIGQEISLVVPKSFITVVTKEVKEYKEYIPFDTKYEETKVLYKGEYRIKINGEKGERQVKAEITKENGIEVSKNILEEKIIKQPVTKVVLKGIKNPPPRIGTGTFAKPTSRGYITSPFGIRWGRRHTGIDIGMPTGTTVKASDGGKVIYAGWKGAYGKLVIIDHGRNMQTYYAHLSKILVKKGDKVFKGQAIAKSGNTGRSTGPHLHFEVRKNGVPVNPIKYVRY
ncbi:Murein DD-endopeptidase MepM and murein hydrolase activator NlpD, contain LysM domain [Caminicella sporogenes DSM 14501]|uniref:Murein DD-endopeptidase MepM and murein hydrolase activator NlpD, contain LysM domain n=1 Tax=Caminicella sporogenes DSM 14501 TaxID=1121266 RepID=A0A1M6NGJ3_9FIRM|nr:M23 family metallopeptidase [Caminicella sporogenes]RKD22208.1 hypothetical protein BET04_06195 [Caminicella sporogenes]SHJ94901.1 Murein DD-endopeptidase MepM and murein hydrolase activator NlpD, contain LysM domain [Caminicella sporogenes DSM 14501]